MATGWHIRTGELVLATGRVPSARPILVHAGGTALVRLGWLSDVIFALLWRWKGLAAVAAFCGIVIALAAATLLRACSVAAPALPVALRRDDGGGRRRQRSLPGAPMSSRSFFYALALWVVERDYARGRLLWLLVPLTALWANLHARFIAWGVTLGVLGRRLGRRARVGRMRRYGLLASGACAAASLLNPRLAAARPRLPVPELEVGDGPRAEFQSPSIRSRNGGLRAPSAVRGRAVGPCRAFERALVLLWGFASLRSARHVPRSRWSLHRLSPAPPRILEACGGADGQTFRGRYFAVSASTWGDVRGPRRGGIAAMLVMALLLPVGFPDSRFPVDAVERNLAALLTGRRLPARADQRPMGGLPDLPPLSRAACVFDGRSDFFGPQLGGDYRTLFAPRQGWRELLDHYGFQLALLPRDWPLSTSSNASRAGAPSIATPCRLYEKQTVVKAAL